MEQVAVLWAVPGENARRWEALGEARPGQSSLSAGALRYRAWAQSWSSAALAPSMGPRHVALEPRPLGNQVM